MSIDITIKQKGFFKKTLPLNVILGNELQFGIYEGVSLTPGKMGGSEILVYYPERIGRGFSVIWNEKEKDTVVLRSLTPTNPEELSAFYRTIERITNYWNCELDVDGTIQTPKQFQDGLQNMLTFNSRAVKGFAENILSGEHGNLTIHCAMWPLVIGKEEAKSFFEDEKAFYDWMHEKQSMDVYFANPHFFRTDKGVLGKYALTENTPSVFPIRPYVPFGIVDPETNKPLECHDYDVALCSTTKNCVLGEVNYETLKNSIPPEKCIKYDGGNVLILGLSLEELEGILILKSN